MGTKSQVAEMNTNDTLETVFLFLIPRLCSETQASANS
jgi:hypothetical protein